MASSTYGAFGKEGAPLVAVLLALFLTLVSSSPDARCQVVESCASSGMLWVCASDLSHHTVPDTLAFPESNCVFFLFPQPLLPS